MSRKLYLEYGYASIFEYCVQRLGFSEGATHLRRQVAGAARRFPQLLEAIADLRISVSVAAKIAPHLGATKNRSSRPSAVVTIDSLRFFGKAFIDWKIAQRSAGGMTAMTEEQPAGTCPPPSPN